MPSFSRLGMRSDMRRRIVILVFFAIFIGSRSGSIARAEVVDKIVAVVDGRIITLSDVRKEHQVQEVLGDPSETDDELIQSMIDRTLMEGEMAQFPSLEVSDDEVDERMKAISDLKGVAPEEIRNAVIRKIQRRRYLELRYRQFVVVTNDEIEKEYETIFVPEAKRRGLAVPDLKTVEDDIRMILVEKKMSEEVETSLMTLRERSNYEVF
jgi:hypothetical protein